MTWRSPEDFAKETGEIKRLVKGLLRRMVVTLSSGGRWQLLGQRGGAGGDEVVTLEAFTGIGFASRPPKGGKPEVVTGAIGGSKTSVILATRDERTRAAVAGELAEGETAVYNDKAIIVVKADGTVEIRLVGGTALQLALKSDVESVDAKYASHVHQLVNFTANAPTGGPLDRVDPTSAGPPPTYTPGVPHALADAEIVGTTVLKSH